MDKLFPLLSGIFVVALLGGIGYAIKYKKAYWLISGYNSMSEEKKKSVDAEKMGRFIGNCLFALCGLMAVAFTFFTLGITVGGLITLGLLLPCVIYMVIHAQRFGGNLEKKDGRMSTQTKVTIALLLVVLGGVGAGVFVLMNQSAKPVQYNVTASTLEIKCMFGETVALKDIQGLELVQVMPQIGTRTFGSALGDQLRGSFTMADGTPARLFMENATPPFVHFVVGSTAYYLNGATADSTNKLYSKLKQ